MASTSCPARTSTELPTETRSSTGELLLIRTSSGRCPSVSRKNPPNRKCRVHPEIGDRERPVVASFGTAWGSHPRLKIGREVGDLVNSGWVLAGSGGAAARGTGFLSAGALRCGRGGAAAFQILRKQWDGLLLTYRHRCAKLRLKFQLTIKRSPL